MSKQYNKTTFVGHLCTDPEMRYAPSGTPVTTFNVANNDQHTSEKGDVVKTTTWFRCTAWGKQAEVCSQYLHKGSKVLVEGRLTPDKKTGRPRLWTRQDGTVSADFELTILEIHFLDNRSEVDANEIQTPPIDEIPF